MPISLTVYARTANMVPMSVYEEVLATGGYIAYHESDLYIEVNEANREILNRHPLEKSNATKFRNAVTGKMCWDVPFAYDPFWNKAPKA
jgi:hypothetical protein